MRTAINKAPCHTMNRLLVSKALISIERKHTKQFHNTVIFATEAANRTKP